MTLPEPDAERSRLQALARYDVLDTAPEEAFDRLTRLAAKLLGAPISLLTFVDAGRVWVKSSRGLDVRSMRRDAALCARVVETGAPLVIPDARLEPGFASNPFVTGAPQLRFYAGTPLVTPDGQKIGTLCVLDTCARQPSPQQLGFLADLAALAVDQLELRREAAERARAEAEAATERSRLRAVIESLPFDLWVCDAAGRYVMQNSVGIRLWGENLGLTAAETPAPAELRAIWSANNARVLAGETVRAECTYLRDGEQLHFVGILAPIRDEKGEVSGFVGVDIDITERKRAEARLAESEARLRTAIESLPFDFWICDSAGRYIMNNATCREHWGSHIGKRPEETGVPQAVGRLWAETNARVLRGETLRYETTYGRGDGERCVEALLCPVHSGGEIIGLVGVNIDITERKRAEERIHHLAHHDELTGLANRRGFKDRLGEAVGRARRRGELAALLLVDVDAFKAINDTLGHDAGDVLLREIAARLQGCRRETDLVARLGGDEFALILEGLLRPEDADLVARRIADSIGRPFLLEGSMLSPTVSIGIACFPTDASTVPELLRHADIALYHAKETDRGRWRFFAERRRA
jgi:diguanylate cyclase (GGDEF)-like protein/PAS domain S-box-containing protein